MNVSSVAASNPAAEMHPARVRRNVWDSFVRGWVLTEVAILFGAGCTITPPTRNMESSIHAREDIVATHEQIRLRMRALVKPFSGVIVEAADQIREKTPDPKIQREALLWKMEGVPAVREALFRPNPFSAVMDTWVLTWQMTDYFESGHGRETLGESAPAAANACRKLAAEIERVAASLTKSGDVSDARKFARQVGSGTSDPTID